MASPTVLNTSKLGNAAEKLPDAVQASRDTVTIYWYYLDGTAVAITGATITGVYQNVSSEIVYAIDGVLSVTNGATGEFTWAYGAGDVGSSGDYLVQMKAVLTGGTVIYSSKVPWHVEETLGVGVVAAGVLVGVSAEEGAWLTAAEGTGNALTDYLLIADILDENDMASDSDVYPATQQSVKAYVDAGGGSALDGLTDVTVTTPAEPEVLKWDDGTSEWVNGTMEISEMTNVAFVGVAADDEVLAWDFGTNRFINQTAAEAGLAAATHAHEYVSEDAAVLEKSGAYELAAGDEAKIVECDGTFAITLPDGLDAGFQVVIVNIGAGTITLAAATTLSTKDAAATLPNQYGAATAYHSGSNVWIAFGDLE